MKSSPYAPAVIAVPVCFGRTVPTDALQAGLRRAERVPAGNMLLMDMPASDPFWRCDGDATVLRLEIRKGCIQGSTEGYQGRPLGSSASRREII